ncbi:hypothetical protein BHE74_00019819 [Ensete ventricosum]|nr:hypothetical protein BHE74_00019819 [Ensete ventricosum]
MSLKMRLAVANPWQGEAPMLLQGWCRGLLIMFCLFFGTFLPANAFSGSNTNLLLLPERMLQPWVRTPCGCSWQGLLTCHGSQQETLSSLEPACCSALSHQMGRHHGHSTRKERSFSSTF